MHSTKICNALEVVLLAHLQQARQHVLLRAGACKYAAIAQYAHYVQEPSVTPRRIDNAVQHVACHTLQTASMLSVMRTTQNPPIGGFCLARCC